jgi:hypothetical protein
MSDVTTLAVGEEGDGPAGGFPFDLPVFDPPFGFPPRGGGDVTTLAIGEEGDGGDVTTLALGEEGGPGMGEDYIGL